MHLKEKMVAKIFSIVGTDTGIGKTYVTVEILNYLNSNGFNASALKPISAGLIQSINGVVVNEDVEKLFQASKTKLPYTQISPISLQLPIAPHIAAKIENIDLNVNNIIAKTEESIQILSKTEDYILIEGVGGIMVPLNNTETYIDLLKTWQHQVILVVGVKLGCLNHTLLTIATLLEKSINVVGWIANCISEDMPYLKENVEYLSQKLTMPLLGVVAHNAAIIFTADFKNILVTI